MSPHKPPTAKRAQTVAETTDPLDEFPWYEQTEEGGWNLQADNLLGLWELVGKPKNPHFIEAMLNGIINVSGRDEVMAQDKNHALAIVDSIGPNDPVEAMLASQMAAVHLAMMRHSRYMAAAETIPQLDLHEKIFNKLARTFTAQIETLRKYRTGGEQKVTVRHVHVGHGGQAIVGDVKMGG